MIALESESKRNIRLTLAWSRAIRNGERMLLLKESPTIKGNEGNRRREKKKRGRLSRGMVIKVVLESTVRRTMISQRCVSPRREITTIKNQILNK